MRNFPFYFVIILVGLAQPAEAANVHTVEQHQFFLVPEFTVFEKELRGPIIIVPVGTVLPEPETYFDFVNGQVEVTVVEDFIDTMANGEPRDPITLRKVFFRFFDISFADEVEADHLNRLQGPFALLGEEVSSELYDPCSVSDAIGERCITLGSGLLPASFTGTWSVGGISGTGNTAHGNAESSFAFSITAVSVPLPGSLFLMFSAALFFIRSRNIYFN